MIVEMGKETLKRLGYSVTTQTSSIKALELFRMKPMEFNLVITDQTMSLPLSSPRFSACCARVSAFNQKLTLSSSKCNNTQVSSILVCDKTLSSDVCVVKDNNY